MQGERPGSQVEGEGEVQVSEATVGEVGDLVGLCGVQLLLQAVTGEAANIQRPKRLSQRVRHNREGAARLEMQSAHAINVPIGSESRREVFPAQLDVSVDLAGGRRA